MRRHTSDVRGQMSDVRHRPLPRRVRDVTGIRSCEHTRSVTDVRDQRTDVRANPELLASRLRIRHRPVFDRPTINAASTPKEKTSASPVAETLFTFARTVSDVREQMSDVRHRSRTPQHNNPTNMPPWLKDEAQSML